MTLEVEKKYVPAMGNPNARIFVLGEGPGWEEHLAGRPFIGPSGKELDSLLKAAGISRSECWISNACKYYVPPNTGTKKIPFHVRAKNVGIDMNEQLADLQNEINAIKPNVVLALGGTALWAMTGSYAITNYRGSILFARGVKVVATFHPAHLLHQAAGEIKGYWNRSIMILDMKRAVEESLTKELELPSRNLWICTSSAALADFKHRYRNHTRPAVDIEARGHCIPTCIGAAFTPYEGMVMPLWNKGEIEEIAKIPDSEMVQMWILMAQILWENEIVGQNFKYDQDKISRLGFAIRKLASDTMLKAFTINPELPKALAFNQSVRTREPFYKDEGMYEGKYKDLLIGCARDGCVTKELDLSYDKDIDELEQRDWYENFIMHLHELYLGIEQEGFVVNVQKREELIKKYVIQSEHLAHEMFCLTGEFVNVNSPKQVYNLLFEVLKLPRRPGTGEEEITALLNNQGKTGVHDPGHRRVCEIVLEKRRVDKTIGNYLMALPDYDGKMKTTYYLCLETGRTSTGQLEPPIRPILEYRDEENKKKKKSIGSAFQTMTKHGDIGHDVRSQYEPEKGHVFVQADKAQAEARVVFLLADDEQALKDIDEHDYHALTASWFFGGIEDDYSKKVLGYESPIRFAGKTLRHSGHLGAGKRRAATEVNTQARKYHIYDKDNKLFRISEAFAEISLKKFHAKQPRIQHVFHNGIIKALETGKRYLTSSVPYGINAKYGGKRQFFERWGDELFRMGFSYIPQRSVSDSTKADALRLKKKIRQLRIILEAHDALVFMVPENLVDDWSPIIKDEMEKPIRFDTCSLPRRDLVIPCELEVGYNYMELKKFRIAVESQNIVFADIKPKPEPLTVTERFRVVEIPQDSYLDRVIYDYTTGRHEDESI